MKIATSNPRRLGAIYLDGATHFRVWAPFADRVSIVGDFNDWNPAAHPMWRTDDGIWSREVHGAIPDHAYQFELTRGEHTACKNDPYARTIHPEKRTGLIYADRFKWHSPEFVLAPHNELVIYELHVGTFAKGPHHEPGKFDQVTRRLPYLKNLGVNAIEIMPASAFPSERSWGYNPTNPFAVEESYGGPDALKALVDAAHKEGIGVIMDVVYNHFGPDNLDLWQFDGWNENEKGGIYFYNDHRSWTPWGDNRPDYGRNEVRQYIRDNALFWLEEFHIDGLRLDSTLFIRNTRGDNVNPETELPEGWSLLQWLNKEIATYFPGRITIAEDLQNNEWITRSADEDGAGFTMQWDAAFVHPVRTNVVVPEDKDRSMEGVANAIRFRYNDDPFRRIIYSESHDEVANGKARVPHEINPGDTGSYYSQKRSVLAAGLALTAPGIPMLFEGQEFLEDGWFRDDVALDWTKLETFHGINRLYHDLIALRRNLYGNTRGLTGPHVRVQHINDHDKVIAFHRWAEGGRQDDVIVVASFANRAIEEYRLGFPGEGEWFIRFNSDWKGYSEDFHDIQISENRLQTEPENWDEFKHSALLTLPPYGLLILSQERKPA